MKYMLLIYSAEDCWTENERKDCMLCSMQVGDELKAKGKLIASAPLHSVATATSARVCEGKLLLTDGPFAETTEQLGGYFIVDVDSLEEAIDLASRLPPAAKGTVEIRPLLPLPSPLSLPEYDANAADELAGDEALTSYLLLMYAEEGAWPSEEHAPAIEQSVAVCRELHQSGQFLSAAPLQPPATATCVRLRNGTREVVDGPFPETKEQLGGYFLIRVPNLDVAIAVAAKLPGSRRGTAEIRPLFPLPPRPSAGA